MKLLSIPYENINQLNNGFYLCSGLMDNHIKPIESNNEGSGQINIVQQVPSSIVKEKINNTTRMSLATEYPDIHGSPLVFPTVINVPNEKTGNYCNNVATVDDVDGSCSDTSNKET